jgi:hypothetical protein
VPKRLLLTMPVSETPIIQSNYLPPSVWKSANGQRKRAASITPPPSQPRVVKKRATGLSIVTFSDCLLLTLFACTHLCYAMLSRGCVFMFNSSFPHHVSPRQLLQRSNLGKVVLLIGYCSFTSLITFLLADHKHTYSDSDADEQDVDVPVPPAPRKQKARKSGESY